MLLLLLLHRVSGVLYVAESARSTVWYLLRFLLRRVAPGFGTLARLQPMTPTVRVRPLPTTNFLTPRVRRNPN